MFNSTFPTEQGRRGSNLCFRAPLSGRAELAGGGGKNDPRITLKPSMTGRLIRRRRVGLVGVAVLRKLQHPSGRLNFTRRKNR